MFWLILALLVIFAGFALRKQRRSYAVEREPWEADPGIDDEPLDMDEIRRAEEEWETESSWDPPEEEWR